MEYKDALEILKRENINLEEFETSEEYKFLCNHFHSTFDDIYKNISGFQVIIDGNVEQIIISGKDEIKLHIVYSLRSDLLVYEQVAYVVVKNDEHKKWIRENLYPNTRIKCVAKYNGKINNFDLVSIINTSLKMKFGHYVCPNCGYDHGKKEEAHYRCICDGTKLNYVDNFYVE